MEIGKIKSALLFILIEIIVWKSRETKLYIRYRYEKYLNSGHRASMSTRYVAAPVSSREEKKNVGIYMSLAYNLNMNRKMKWEEEKERQWRIRARTWTTQGSGGHSHYFLFGCWKTYFRLCCQAAPAKTITRVRYNQMADAHKEEEQVQLLNEEVLRSGAQSQNLKLG